MKKVFFISLLSVLVPFVANATDVAPTTNVASTSYVQGAYNALDSQIQNISTQVQNKQDKLTNTSIEGEGTGQYVTQVRANNDGKIVVSYEEVTIPVKEGGVETGQRATIWLE